MTPEGKVKAKVSKLLKAYGVYYFMPVQTGFGAAGLDYHCVFPGGKAFFIETKAYGKNPTYRQDELIVTLRVLGCEVFIINNDTKLAELERYVDANSTYKYTIDVNVSNTGKRGVHLPK